MKICCICLLNKSSDEFYSSKTTKDKLHPYCKSCCVVKANEWKIKNQEKFDKYHQEYRDLHKEEKVEYFKEKNKQWYLNNKEQESIRGRKYRLEHKEARKEYAHNYYLENKDKIYNYSRIWVTNNPDKAAITSRKSANKKRSTIQGKITANTKCMIYISLRNKKEPKNNKKWQDLVGFTCTELMNHLEKLFQPGMSWENYGKYGWHIDHILPVTSFKFTSYNDDAFKECFSLKNLQPLWWRDNLTKGNKIL